MVTRSSVGLPANALLARSQLSWTFLRFLICCFWSCSCREMIGADFLSLLSSIPRISLWRALAVAMSLLQHWILQQCDIILTSVVSEDFLQARFMCLPIQQSRVSPHVCLSRHKACTKYLRWVTSVHILAKDFSMATRLQAM